MLITLKIVYCQLVVKWHCVGHYSVGVKSHLVPDTPCMQNWLNYSMKKLKRNERDDQRT